MLVRAGFDQAGCLAIASMAMAMAMAMAMLSRFNTQVFLKSTVLVVKTVLLFLQVY